MNRPLKLSSQAMSPGPLIRWTALTASGLLGLTVLAGWHLQLPTLVQVHPELVPMQYNTALGFLLGSAGFIALLFEKRSLTLGLSIMLLLLAGITLLQYVLDADFGMDQFFVQAYITVKTSHPGRMAPNTAVCFILIAAILNYLTSAGRHKPLLTSLLTSIVGAIAMASFLDYLLGAASTFVWSHFTLMALHTSVGFLLLVIAIATLLLKQERHEFADPFSRYVLPAWLSLASMVLLFWYALDQREYRHLEQRISTRAQIFHTLLTSNFSSRLQALRRMAQRWEHHNGAISYSEWSADAAHYTRDYPDLQAVEWVDSSYHVRWIVPLAGNEPALNYDTAAEPTRRAALQSARQTHETIVSDTVNLVQGGKGVIAYSPLETRNGFGGFIVGVLRIDRLIENLLPLGLGNDFLVQIFENDRLIHSAGETNANSSSSLSKSFEVALDHTHQWVVRLHPGYHYLGQQISALPFAVLVAGFLLSTLLVAVIRMQSQERHHARLLQLEIDERIRAESIKDRFISTISHELRTPLTAVRGAIGLLAGNAAGPLPKEAQELVTISDNNSKNLLALINDLLDIQKLTSGYMRLDLEPCAIGPLVEQCVANYQAIARKAGDEISLAGSIDNVLVHADELRFQQIMGNLLSNAVKFANAGTQIRVAIEHTDKVARINISNLGTRIPESFRDSIFEPFTQIDSSDSRRAGGTGLGLNITKQLIELHGGRIDYRSDETGTTFFIELPTRTGSTAIQSDTDLPANPAE